MIGHFLKRIETWGYIRKIIEEPSLSKMYYCTYDWSFSKKNKTRAYIRRIREEPSLVKDVLLYL